jgi:hypothetical protein|tara:strand:+ start:35 stop:271 length:237 start_codon:yes stop_codon:yes gene_type:complete
LRFAYQDKTHGLFTAFRHRQIIRWHGCTEQTAVVTVRNDTLGASLTAGRLGEVTVLDDQVLLGAPMRFDEKNIEEFDF